MHNKHFNVLHLASFSGNIGDVANHAGARNLFNSYLDYSFSYTELEIREFYWKKRKFDRSFVTYANSFDLLIIGGGNYFELWPEGSATGTSIDIDLLNLQNLSVPTLFFALGVDLGLGCTPANAHKFNKFFNVLRNSNQFFVCVRNDGASKALQKVLVDKDTSNVPVMPDPAFFLPSIDSDKTIDKSKCIGINIAGDMLDIRFAGVNSIESFIHEMAQACMKIMDLDDRITIKFIPHIWKDIQIISSLISKIEDNYMRRRVKVAGLDPNYGGLQSFIEEYKSCCYVFGMRFHANVCPIALGIPTRGLLSFPQIELLYEELGLTDRLIDVRIQGFAQKMIDIVYSDIVSAYPSNNKKLYEQQRSQLKDLV